MSAYQTFRTQNDSKAYSCIHTYLQNINPRPAISLLIFRLTRGAGMPDLGSFGMERKRRISGSSLRNIAKPRWCSSPIGKWDDRGQEAYILKKWVFSGKLSILWELWQSGSERKHYKVLSLSEIFFSVVISVQWFGVQRINLMLFVTANIALHCFL